MLIPIVGCACSPDIAADLSSEKLIVVASIFIPNAIIPFLRFWAFRMRECAI